MDLYETLGELCKADGVSGGETNASKVALEYLKEYDKDAYIDSFNNVIAFIGEQDNGKKTLLLDAHIDEIGLIVTHIDEDGFIKFSKCGGIDRRVPAAQTVTIWGREPIKGIISTLPPHVSEKKDKGTAPELKDLAIDAGYSKQELEKLVSPGDFITFDAEFRKMPGSKVAGKALDDRAGAAAVLYALELLRGKELKVNLAVQLASQEEVGGRGARIAAFRARADYSLAVDVSFARSPGIEPWQAGKMGKGAMIGIAPSLDRGLYQRLIQLCERENIPYQREVMGGDTGTDSDDISETGAGVCAMLVSIPQKYMHTPAEVVDLEDIKAVAETIAAFAVNGEE